MFSLIMESLYFSLAAWDSIYDKFRFTTLRNYCSKSEFYDVFKQDKCLRLEFKRIFICLCLRSFDAQKTRIKRLVSSTFHRIVQRLRIANFARIICPG